MKNRTLRIGLIVAILTLVTSCFMGSTFAKYVTNGTGSDEARVAKWGVSIDASGFKGFQTSYVKDDDSFAGTNTVVADSTVNVVAPGTKGTFGSFAVSGTPEVAVRVTYEATVELSDNWIVAGDFYCPITVTVAGNAICGLDYSDAASFQTAIKTAIDERTADYAANTTIVADNTLLPISWAWDFENKTGSKNNQTDENDTVLGDTAVAEDITISIAVKCTVTQID